MINEARLKGIDSLEWLDIKLKLLTKEDLPTICVWRNSPEVLPFMLPKVHVSMSVLLVWLNKILNLDTWFPYIIIYKGQKCGYFELKNIDYINKICESGMFFSPKYIGCGIGSYIMFIREAILERLGVDDLISNVSIYNVKSLSHMRKIGGELLRKNGDILTFVNRKKERRSRIFSLAKAINMYDELINLINISGKLT
ncbi:MAG: GNAT family N-acetyltransferase [Clostridia bacterium]|nr:GNAT family N-acetyltransferase [Clostridia bacterium]